MRQIEKSVFICYRRTNSAHAYVLYQYLRAKGYDVFLNDESIKTGRVSSLSLNQIKARAHFLVFATPSGLELCEDPTDWLLEEINTALQSQRHIGLISLKRFDDDAVTHYLKDNLARLTSHPILNLPTDAFMEAMATIRREFLDIPVDVVLHPTPNADKRKVAQQIAEADKARPVNKNQLIATEYYEYGNHCCFIGERNASIEPYSLSLELDTINPNAYHRRGLGYYVMKESGLSKADQHQAIEQATALLRKYPNDAELYRTRGVAYSWLGDSDKAIADYTRVIKLMPKFAIAYLSRGNAYSVKKDYVRALADYNEGIKHNPTYALIYQNRGTLYENMGDFDNALADYTQIIKIEGSASAYIERGLFYISRRHINKAIDDFTSAIEIDPQNEFGYYNRAYCYYLQELYAEALADYAQTIALNPNYARAYYTRGLIYDKTGEVDKALHEYSKTINLDPLDGSAYIKRGNIHLQKRDYHHAIEDFSNAIKTDSGYYEAFRGRGCAYDGLGDYNQALSDYNRALKIRPNDEETQKMRDELFKKRKNG